MGQGRTVLMTTDGGEMTEEGGKAQAEIAGLTIHPHAAIFPMMADDELDALAADIEKNGLNEPILVHKKTGFVVDGRNRIEACKRAGVEPHTKEVEGDPLILVLSYNLKRRHLTPGQRAIAAAKAWNVAITEGKAKPARGGDQRKKFSFAHPAQDFAREFVVNQQYVKDARKLLQEAPGLAESVNGGSMNLPEALGELEQREQEEREQEERKAQEKRDRDTLRRTSPDLYREVEEDKLPLKEALRQARISASYRSSQSATVTDRFATGVARLRQVDYEQLVELYDRGRAADILTKAGGQTEITTQELRKLGQTLIELADKWPWDALSKPLDEAGGDGTDQQKPEQEKES
jgi:hypothetical protein